MNGSCNAGMLMLKTKSWYNNFQLWLNEKQTVNMLLVFMSEEAMYKVSTHADRDWESTTPKGDAIIQERHWHMQGDAVH